MVLMAGIIHEELKRQSQWINIVFYRHSRALRGQGRTDGSRLHNPMDASWDLRIRVSLSAAQSRPWIWKVALNRFTIEFQDRLID